MVKPITFLAVMLAGMTANAQTWKLTEMSQETFAAGGDSQWSFEKFNLTTGDYSRFTLYDENCAANYLDWYNPERLEGKLITEIPGEIADYAGGSYSFLQASNKRMGWCDKVCAEQADLNGDTRETFCYVARDDREGFGYETYANFGFASVITFTVPEDGYYVVKGKVEREDCISMGPMNLISRYRYASSENQDNVNPVSTMGFQFIYGASEGDAPGYNGDCTLALGAGERFYHQTPVEYTLAFQGKKGDKISFEPNVKTTGLQDDGGGARACWSRTFFQLLDVEKVEKEAAEANENFVDPYGTEALDALKEYFGEIENAWMDVESGSGYGQYPVEAVNAFEKVFIEVQEAMNSGAVNIMPAIIYENMLREAWEILASQKITVDFSESLNNYRLFWLNGSEKAYNADAMAVNEANPWNFGYYRPADGTFTAFGNHDNASLAGDKPAWYEKSGDWLYISDDGFVHPMVDKASSIMFTAPVDHVYKVEVGVSRSNPGTNDWPMYLVGHFFNNGNTTCDKGNYFLREAYGHKSNSNYNGTDTLVVEMFVNMKAGDKIAFENDCYTQGRNSSCGTEYTLLRIYSCLNEEIQFTADSASRSGLEFFDPYAPADMDSLKTLVAEIKSFMQEISDELAGPDEDGNIPEGMYDIAIAEELETMLEVADSYIEVEDEGTVTQVEVDLLIISLNDTYKRLVDSRAPFTFDINGQYNVRLAGTEYRFTQKNATSDGAGTFYYMGFMSIQNVIDDSNKNGFDIGDYLWEWTFDKQTVEVTNDDTGETYNVEVRTIGNKNGLVNTDGFVREVSSELTNYNYESYSLRFVKKELTDSVFAVQRVSDGRYWTNTINWNAPYNKFGLSDEPQYVFVLDPASPTTGIESVEPTENAGEVVSVEYYNLGGMKVAEPVKGIYIKKTVYSNGKVETRKFIIK